jgi:hypothetical protein
MTKKKIILIIIIVLFILGLAGGIFLYIKNRNTNNDVPFSQTPPEEQEIKEKEDIPTEMSDEERFIFDVEFGDYKIFSDKLLGFSFQYPKEWKIEIRKDKNNLNNYDIGFTKEDREIVAVFPLGYGRELLVCQKINKKCEYRSLLVSGQKIFFHSVDEYLEYIFSDFVNENSKMLIDAKTINQIETEQIDRLVRSFKFCAYNENNCLPLKNSDIEKINNDVMSIIDLNINNWQKYHSDIFGFSFNIPKEMKVVESKENKTVSLIFMDFRVMLFDVEYIKKPVEVSDDVDWNRIKILESFVINGEPIDLIAHNQPELDDIMYLKIIQMKIKCFLYHLAQEMIILKKSKERL